jgi:hypothetical protein
MSGKSVHAEENLVNTYDSASDSEEWEDYTIALNDQGVNDEDIKELLQRVILSPYREEIKYIYLRNNNITDSGAITLACMLDYLNDLVELDVRENNITQLGIQILQVKATTMNVIIFYDILDYSTYINYSSFHL